MKTLVWGCLSFGLPIKSQWSLKASEVLLIAARVYLESFAINSDIFTKDIWKIFEVAILIVMSQSEFWLLTKLRAKIWQLGAKSACQISSDPSLYVCEQLIAYLKQADRVMVRQQTHILSWLYKVKRFACNVCVPAFERLTSHSERLRFCHPTEYTAVSVCVWCLLFCHYLVLKKLLFYYYQHYTLKY